MELRNKRVLVTGGAGFIGSHMTDVLLHAGATVSIVDNLTTGRRENLNPAARFYELDTNDPALRGVFEKEKPEIVYHLAFTTVVPKSVEDPLSDARSITGSLNVIEQAKRFSVRKFFFPSSGFLYGNTAPRPTDETSPVEPISPYVVSKHAVEEYLSFYRRAYSLPSVVFRYAAIYGPRQLVTGAMQDYIKKLSKGEQAEMYGDPSEKTRDFVYIDDVVRANLLALDLPDNFPNPVFNIGTGIETSLLDLYQKLAALLRKDPKPILMPEKPGEQLRYALDASKIEKTLGWRPAVSLDSGLKRTLEAYRLL